ncbi:hypothetical protein CYMTET_3988 [Cymbomonas tetramitiformis]|uniref:Uncharacterized protein n=1 Tax=Cymbomonas tetramitiformis TaxID=36881 RepID=A0AAE0H2C0_9CHLO|nr:hypothetical protein CYMTET_3988 [Cymbomonas tetramitiformis]
MAPPRGAAIQMGMVPQKRVQNHAKRTMLNKRLADDPMEAAMTSRHEEEVPQENVNKRHAVGEWVESSFALLSEQEPMREIDVEMSEWLGEDVYVMHPAVPPSHESPQYVPSPQAARADRAIPTAAAP